MNPTILITGATGNIGAAVVGRVLEEWPEARMVLIIRATSDSEARLRVERARVALDPEAGLDLLRARTTVMAGDITRPRLGLNPMEWRRLAEETTHIIHSAASTKFGAPLDEARLTNVTGTAHVIEFARKAYRAGRLEHLVHVSTAYVCGDRAGLIGENDPPADTEFSNSYERSKWEAERLVRAAMDELPVSLVRPSVVVGDSRTGRTVTFTGIYPPLRLICDGRLKAIPCLPEARLDVVPLDYVAAAIVQLVRMPERACGRTFHLTAGEQSSLPAAEIVRRAAAFFGKRASGGTARQPQIVSSEGNPAVGSACQNGHHRDPFSLFCPYLSVHRSFDRTNTDSLLAPLGIRPPALSEYFDTILTHCLQVNWGKVGHPARRAA